MTKRTDLAALALVAPPARADGAPGKAGRARPLLLLLLLLFLPPALHAQEPVRGRLVRVDVEVFHVTASVLWPVSASWRAGPELGGGLLEQKTFAPGGDDFTSMIHVGGVLSRPLSERLSWDTGVRFGVGELRSTACSGCIPPGYGAVVVGGAWGGDTFRAGSRVTVARVSGVTVLAWSPLFLRLRF